MFPGGALVGNEAGFSTLRASRVLTAQSKRARWERRRPSMRFKRDASATNWIRILKHAQSDHEMLKPASECRKIDYPKPDGKLTFDRLSSVFLSYTNYDDNQPAHLTLKDPAVPINVNLRHYAGPRKSLLPGWRL
ncbi:Putative electron transport protein (plasmid) [Paraburkholderia phenoliruptrix BR3459a]|uniref:Electron transfer flavoprotein-ubiquinone oxidoreductase n=2 Tax=Paraburkholderia phenoliruptrix TaxID=252970 RepID=K0E1H1_9BURK|nr:Putative electron transport protein [Paraburkholderia phenoliruptrix BR3459a]